MTQTATFPDLESSPTTSSQAILYFNATLGTLTEVDLVTSGSFQSEFYAENLGPSSSTIQGTTRGNLSINVPSGTIPVTIPSVTETFDAAPFDGSIDYGGTSGKDFAPVTSSATPQTMVLTAPADLAAFTGHFQMPLSVAGHATGTASSTDGDLSAGFKTQTSATITVIYHYTPNLPSLNPPPTPSPSPPTPGTPGPGNGTGSSGSPATPGSSGAGAFPGAGGLLATPSLQHKKHRSLKGRKSIHKGGHHASVGHLRAGSGRHHHHLVKTHLIHHHRRG
jgi:hypothetical protein